MWYAVGWNKQEPERSRLHEHCALRSESESTEKERREAHANRCSRQRALRLTLTKPPFTWQPFRWAGESRASSFSANCCSQDVRKHLCLSVLEEDE